MVSCGSLREAQRWCCERRFGLCQVAGAAWACLQTTAISLTLLLLLPLPCAHHHRLRHEGCQECDHSSRQVLAVNICRLKSAPA